MDLAHRDTIREGDGVAMMSIWKLNMTRFWHGNHFKYLLLGHRLLYSQEEEHESAAKQVSSLTPHDVVRSLDMRQILEIKAPNIDQKQDWFNIIDDRKHQL